MGSILKGVLTKKDEASAAKQYFKTANAAVNAAVEAIVDAEHLESDTKAKKRSGCGIHLLSKNSR